MQVTTQLLMSVRIMFAKNRQLTWMHLLRCYNDNRWGVSMSLTAKLKNLGIIKQAEFSLGDLTIICGENNTGKTYITYALYGFLDSCVKMVHTLCRSCGANKKWGNELWYNSPRVF